MNSEMALCLIVFLFYWFVKRIHIYADESSFVSLVFQRFSWKRLLECAVAALLLEGARTLMLSHFPGLGGNWPRYALPSPYDTKVDRAQAFVDACARASDGNLVIGILVASLIVHAPYWPFLQEKAFRHRYLKLWQVLLAAVANSAYACALGMTFARGLVTFMAALFLAYKYHVALVEALAASNARDPSLTKPMYRVALATSTGYAIMLFVLTQIAIPSIMLGQFPTVGY